MVAICTNVCTFNNTFAAPSVIKAPVFRGSTARNTLKLQLSRASEEYGPIGQYLVCVVPADMIGKEPEQFTTKELYSDR